MKPSVEMVRTMKLAGVKYLAKSERFVGEGFDRYATNLAACYRRYDAVGARSDRDGELAAVPSLSRARDRSCIPPLPATLPRIDPPPPCSRCEDRVQGWHVAFLISAAMWAALALSLRWACH